ncbi:MAG: OmpA family protein [Flavobacteriales bacterium]|nr:OmpA family protein [Flavobacteriales bacterium]
MRSTLRTLFLVCIVPVHGQELVVNGGFEQRKRCPTRFNEKPARAVERVKTLGGMPGYFNGCGKMMGTPVNWAGVEPAFEGEAYMGLVLTAHGGGECAVREFVQLELAEPLVNGGKYLLSFHVSVADRSGYMTDRIGACFSTQDRTDKHGIGASLGKPDVDNALNRFISDTAGWMKVEGIFNARGGERFVQIGNFQLCDRASRKAVVPNQGDGKLHNMKRKGEADMDSDRQQGLRRRLLATQAYIYLDAVSLVPLSATVEARILSRKDACDSDPGKPSAENDLVPDPSFDLNIPAHRSAWKNASGGTPDLEEGRTGIYLHSAVNKDHREYIHTPLKERLDPCGVYDVRLRIRRNPTYAYVVDRIGVALTEDFENDRRRDLLSFPLLWELHGKGVMDDAEAWTTICGTFAGGGCADRLLVGNFSGDDSTTVVQRDPDDGPFAYYFLDDVSLWRTGTLDGCSVVCPEGIVAIPVGTDTLSEPPRWPLILHFDVDDHVPGDDLLPTAEELFHVLAGHPDLQVTVAGHTDASGNEHANMKLAEERAVHVRSELIRLGIPAKRITVEVHGSKAPIATNGTPEGRSLNRRVEISYPGSEH